MDDARETFVVMNCGCHAGLGCANPVLYVCTGRPAAVLAADRIGQFRPEDDRLIAGFLDGQGSSVAAYTVAERTWGPCYSLITLARLA